MKETIPTWRWTLGAALLSTTLGLGLWGLSTADVQADRDEHDEEEYGEKHSMAMAARAPTNATYSEECGSCHTAYPPGLLPTESWKAIMSGLEDHFDENAELDAATQEQITGYLKRYAANNGDFQSKRYLSGLAVKEAPMRITELPFFIQEHDEIPARLVKGNDKVGSFSQCDACHQDAAQGKFDEDKVYISGYGRWDD